MKKRAVFEFWIKSSGGTNTSEIVEIDAQHAKNKDLVRDACERWCSQFPSWNGERGCSYGWKRVKKRLRRPRFSVRNAKEIYKTLSGWIVWDNWNQKDAEYRYPKKRTASDIAEMKNDGLHGTLV